MQNYNIIINIIKNWGFGVLGMSNKKIFQIRTAQFPQESRKKPRSFFWGGLH